MDKNIKYTFRRAEPEKYSEQFKKSKEHGIKSSEYSRDISDNIITCDDHAIMLGRIWALFGKPDDPSMYEDFYNYTISAENENGKILYLEIYEHTKPAVNGIDTENSQDLKNAVDQLCELINSTPPADYEWSGVVEEDFPVDVTYAVKDGVTAYTDSFIRKMKGIEDRFGKKYGEVSDEVWNRLEYAYEHDMSYDAVMSLSDADFNELYFSDSLEEEKRLISDAAGIPYETVKDMSYEEFQKFSMELFFNGSSSDN